MFGPRARAFVWLATGISTIAIVVVILKGASLEQPVPTPHDSFGGGPLGSRAFVETLEALDLHVLRAREGNFTSLRAPLIFIEPDATDAVVDGQRRQLADVLDERDQRGLVSVIVLPKWSMVDGEAVPAGEHAQEILDVVMPGATLVHSGGMSSAPVRTTVRGSLGELTIEVPWLQLIEGAEGILATEEGALVAYAGNHLVVSDPDLLHSWNLHRADHARLWRVLIEHLGATDTIAIDEVFHGHGARRSLAAALGEVPAVYLTAHALLLLAIVVWAGSARFGRARDLDPPRHGPSEAIEVSAFVLAEGQPIARLTESYVRELIADLALRLGHAHGRPPAEQIAHVDGIAARRGEGQRAEMLLRRAQALGKDPRPALSVARDAHGLYLRLTRKT
jgi:hypothetical protein